MQIKLSTVKLKEMVARVIKGSSNNKLIPITSLMEIKVENNVLSFTTTDVTNYVTVFDTEMTGDDFYAVVYADTFAKLVAKMTSEYVTLSFDEEHGILTVIGNGTYKIELPLDENGQFIKYPNPFMMDGDKEEISLSTIKVILNTLKPALAVKNDHTMLENPCYTGYYVGDSVVATDTYKIADMGIQLFHKPALISVEMMDLLNIIVSEKIIVTRDGNRIQFNAEDCTIYGTLMEDIEDYAHEAISELVNTEFDSMCGLPKSELLQVLDRLSLFVGTYDKNAIRFTFTKDGLEISSKASSGVEIVEYQSSENFIPFTCLLDIQMITQEVKAIEADVIEMYYGEDNAIKMIDGNITVVVALLDDESAEEE